MAWYNPVSWFSHGHENSTVNKNNNRDWGTSGPPERMKADRARWLAENKDRLVTKTRPDGSTYQAIGNPDDVSPPELKSNEEITADARAYEAETNRVVGNLKNADAVLTTTTKVAVAAEKAAAGAAGFTVGGTAGAMAAVATVDTTVEGYSRVLGGNIRQNEFANGVALDGATAAIQTTTGDRDGAAKTLRTISADRAIDFASDMLGAREAGELAKTTVLSGREALKVFTKEGIKGYVSDSARGAVVENGLAFAGLGKSDAEHVQIDRATMAANIDTPSESTVDVSVKSYVDLLQASGRTLDPTPQATELASGSAAPSTTAMGIKRGPGYHTV